MAHIRAIKMATGSAEKRVHANMNIETGTMTMRKRIITAKSQQVPDRTHAWLDIEQLAQIEISSEAPDAPVESAINDESDHGWRASEPGEQVIRLLFDAPQKLRVIRLLFVEESRVRTQEFVLKWSPDGGMSWLDIARQQYNFSPPDTVRELEDYLVELDAVSALELRIVPEIGGGDAHATLAQLRIG
jgi:hypothetical protein